MTGSNEVRITARGSSTEVQDQVDALNAKIIDLTGKLKENARVSRQSSKEAKEGFQDFKGTLLDVDDTLRTVGQGMLAFFSVNTIKEFVGALIEEEKRLRDLARNQSLSLDQSIFLTGDGANAAQVFATVQGASSSVALEERAGVFQAIRDAAPGLDLETALNLTRGTLEGVGQITSSADVSSKIGADASRLAFIGGLDAETALNVSTRANQAQGGRDVIPLVTDAVQKAIGLSPQEDPTELTNQLLAIATTAGQQGLNTRQLRSVIDQAGADRQTRVRAAASEFRRNGYSEAEALEAARIQVGPLSIGRDIERAITGDESVFQQQNFRSAQAFFQGIDLNLYNQNLAAIQAGAPGTIENALASRQRLTREQIELDSIEQERDAIRAQRRQDNEASLLETRSMIEQRRLESDSQFAPIARELELITFRVGKVADILFGGLGNSAALELEISTDQFGTVDIDEQLPPQGGN